MIEIEKTCSLSGHRELKEDFDRVKIKNIFIKLLNGGFNTFLDGMAIGFDIECFKILLELKEFYDFKIIACVPCKNQDKKYNFAERVTYKKMLESADEIIYVSENHTPTCMQKRNMFMVDNSFVLVSYLRKPFGGTFNTVAYAKKQNKHIINI